jgi:predicted alpha/beta hydrolase family esterase/diadenosine tetraphosphate (Ap4A) HIT family hydrolase
MTRLLIIPGLGGSGPEHWQTAWERLDGRCVRVEQADWDAPSLPLWLERLDAAVAASPEPYVLVAHSLGAVLVAHWAAQRQIAHRPLGALLVAPADADSLQRQVPQLAGFCPIPLAELSFPSLVVASRNDPYVSFECASRFARAWGAQLTDLGSSGHINAESQLGTWPAGRALLSQLLLDAPFDLDPRLAADTLLLGQSDACLLLLMNERRYPWLILVPRRANVSELHELRESDRTRLQSESQLVCESLSRLFAPDKLNVAALGNVVRQLHVHHVVRTLGDPAWPGPVWGHSPRQPYAAEELDLMRARLMQGELARVFRPG